MTGVTLELVGAGGVAGMKKFHKSFTPGGDGALVGGRACIRLPPKAVSLSKLFSYSKALGAGETADGGGGRGAATYMGSRPGIIITEVPSL